MKKRLRKKKYLGEFKEEGFVIKAEAPTLKDGLDPETNKFVDELIDFVESRGCCIGGAVGSRTQVFYAKIGRGTCTEEDREAVEEYLTLHPLVNKFKVGPLVDAWYGTDEDFGLEDENVSG